MNINSDTGMARGIILIGGMNNGAAAILPSADGSPELPPDDTESRLRETGKGRELCITTDRAEVEKRLDAIEIAFGDIPFDLIPRMPNLKWLQLWSAGADILQKYPELKTLPFQLTTTSGIHRQQLTEHTFALILTWNRKMQCSFAAQKAHAWTRPAIHEMAVLSGKTMLILGYGAIGETIAQAAQAFGMKVIGIRRHVPAGGQGVSGGVTVLPDSRLQEVLPQADYVVNILPLTPDTAHSIGAKQFDAMKPSVVYVNVGRGATTDEAALTEALTTKKIAAALLDVTVPEPLPIGSPLWDMSNVLITPHYAGFHPNYNGLAMKVAIENLGRYVRGEPLRNLVDKCAGY
ncbi:3-phosphoglycerate dehydrogenase [Spirochaetia bacterium]|nr:3-phosphoglycerate dehydrogenase [Spirochaetia bacterium]